MAVAGRPARNVSNRSGAPMARSRRGRSRPCSLQWSQALGRELQAAPADAPAGAPSPGYFDCWLSVLQSLLLGKGAVSPDELSARKRAWEEAYRRTPHGRPVSLSEP